MCVAAKTPPRRRASVQALTCQFAPAYKKASCPGGLHALTAFCQLAPKLEVMDG